MSAPDAMEALKRRFRQRAHADRESIGQAFARKDRSALLKLAHGLSGAAGIFGYAEISARAALVEDAIDEDVSEPALADLVGALVAELDAVPVAD